MVPSTVPDTFFGGSDLEGLWDEDLFGELSMR